MDWKTEETELSPLVCKTEEMVVQAWWSAPQAEVAGRMLRKTAMLEEAAVVAVFSCGLRHLTLAGEHI